MGKLLLMKIDGYKMKFLLNDGRPWYKQVISGVIYTLLIFCFVAVVCLYTLAAYMIYLYFKEFIMAILLLLFTILCILLIFTVFTWSVSELNNYKDIQ